MQARVLDGDGRLRGEQAGQLLVLLRELAALGLLGEVEVAVHAFAEQHRHAEERVHRRVVRRESDRPRVVGHGCQPKRSRVVDQHAEHSAPDGLVADRLALGGAQARGEEPLELHPRLVDDAERRIPRIGELRRHVDDPLEKRFERELRAEGDARIDEEPEPIALWPVGQAGATGSATPIMESRVTMAASSSSSSESVSSGRRGTTT